MPVHPTIQRVIARAYKRGHGDLHHQSIEQVRAYHLTHRITPALIKNPVQYEEYFLPSGAFIRLHRPALTWFFRKSLPLILFIRPNAFVLKAVDESNYFCHQLAQTLRCLVAVIEPRLAPEYCFPIPLNDSIEAIEYLMLHAKTLNIHTCKIAIWGESCGANLAAAITQEINQCERVIKQQILIYPTLDYYHSYPSKKRYGYGYLLDETFIKWSVKQYTTHPAQYQLAQVSPLLATTFTHLPPTLLIGAEFDPLLDEQMAYAHTLQKSGVKITSHIQEGMVHGFLWYAKKIPAARAAYHLAAHFLKTN